MFSTSCTLVSEEGRGTMRDRHPPLFQALHKPQSSGAHSPTWSSRFDIAVHTLGPGHCYLLSSFFCYFLLQYCIFKAHLKLPQLEFTTGLLGCQYILVDPIQVDIANLAKLNSEHSLQG